MILQDSMKIYKSRSEKTPALRNKSGNAIMFSVAGKRGVSLKALQNKSFAAELGLIFVTMIWGSAFVVVKNATATVPTSWMIAIRFGIAAIFLCAFFHRRLRKIGTAELKWGLFIGLQNVAAFEFQTNGVKDTTAGKNAFLTAVYCVIVPFLYWAVRKKKPRAAQVVSAFLCIAGVGFLSLEKDLSVNYGDLLSLICGLFFAIQIVTIGILTEKYDPILLSITQIGATSVLALPLAALTEPFPSGLPAGSVLSLLYLGLFSTMLTAVLQMVCQKYTPPSKASLIMSLESVFGSLCGIVFLSEPVTPKIIAGFALIFVAIVLSERAPGTFRFRRKSASAGEQPKVPADRTG